MSIFVPIFLAESVKDASVLEEMLLFCIIFKIFVYFITTLMLDYDWQWFGSLEACYSSSLL